jgi:hypothetical protein
MQTKEQIDKLHRLGKCSRIHSTCTFKLGQLIKWTAFTDILGEYHPEELGRVTDIRRMCGRYRITADVIASPNNVREVEADMDCFKAI